MTTITSKPRHFNLALNEDGEGSVSFVADGKIHTVPSDHANFARIADAVLKGEDPSEWLDVARAIEKFSERVTSDGETLFFDGIPVHSSIGNTILRYRSEGRSTAGLVRFLERLNENPSEHSRSNLFDWVDAQDLVIDSEGYFLAFKGVNPVARYDDEGNLIEGDPLLQSLSSGRALVNGVEHFGHIPNAVGDVISMPREEVEFDPAVGCHTGLHVGTYGYANGFGQVLLEVKVDPADVVSVPTDCGAQKMRTCRYTVLAEHEKVGGGSYRGISERYEPAATWSDEATADALEEANVPQGFIARWRERRANRRQQEAS